MKIAIPSNDKINIAERTGRAKGFMVYKIENKEIKAFVYRINNTHDHDHDHGEEHEHSHKELVEFLQDCDLIILKHIGKHLKRDLEKANLQYTFTKHTKLNDIIYDYL